jgi:N-acetylmuramoyl-L-alanine amidase
MKKVAVFLSLSILLLSILSFGEGLSGKIIVLDPGHGGIDKGASGPTGLLEKTINLELALDLEKILKAQGATVYMTRTKDKYVYLSDRIELANKEHADLFVCIHHNSLEGYPNFDETEVYYWNENDSSKMAAEALAQAVGKALNIRWKVKKNDFKVLRIAEVPAVLVESSFISCVKREKWLRNPLNIWKEAVAIDYGILTYFDMLGVK